jgi:foldase protein prsA
MKKKTLLLLTLIGTITLTTACSKATLKESTTAVNAKEWNISSNDYFDKIKEKNISRLVDLIDEKILEKKYKKNEKENKYVEKKITQIKSAYNAEVLPQILRTYYGVESIEELEKYIRLEFKRDEAINDYIESHITNSEIEDYYNKNITGDVRISQIYIKSNIKNSDNELEKKKKEEEALKKANEVIKKLEDKKSWKDLVKEYSDDEATKLNDGDLGFLKATNINEKMNNAIKDLKKGEYTKEPLKTEHGYHILLKTDEKDKPSLKSIKNDIKEKLKAQKLGSSKTISVDTLDLIRKEAKVEFKDDKLNAAYNKYLNTIRDNLNKK